MGGHCLPVDPFYLSWRAREFDMTTEFIELAGKINQQMPYHCVAKVQRALGDAGRPVKGSRIALLGVSYKPGVGDIRESPALKILTLLSALGAELRYHDPSRSRAQVDIASRRYRGAPTSDQARYAHHALRRGRTPRPHERRSPPARADATQKHTLPPTTHSRARPHAI
jgi:nucleotide sugar dehydrogenase